MPKRQSKFTTYLTLFPLFALFLKLRSVKPTSKKDEGKSQVMIRHDPSYSHWVECLPSKYKYFLDGLTWQHCSKMKTVRIKVHIHSSMIDNSKKNHVRGECI